MFDKLRKKAETAVDRHGDKIGQGIDKAAGTASQKSGGKHDDKITKGATSAKDALDKLDGRNDDIRDERRQPPPPAAPPR